MNTWYHLVHFDDAHQSDVRRRINISPTIGDCSGRLQIPEMLGQYLPLQRMENAELSMKQIFSS